MNVFDLLSDKLKQSVQELGFSSPTPVQSEVIPKIINGDNVLFQSDTGTGKTFAYLFPLITKLDALEANDSLNSSVKIIIIAPTFELASQINVACKSVTDIKTALLIGGVPIKRQIELLKEKPQIVIGTASRIVELIHLKKLKIENLFAVVFDETDRLLKREAISDTSDLRNLLSPSTQIIACSATINKQTKIFFADSKNIILPPENILKEKITHWAIFAENRDKIDTLRKFLAAENPKKALVFTSRADQVENIFNKLTYKKVECSCLHAKTDKRGKTRSYISGSIKYQSGYNTDSNGKQIPKFKIIKPRGSKGVVQMEVFEKDYQYTKKYLEP